MEEGGEKGCGGNGGGDHTATGAMTSERVRTQHAVVTETPRPRRFVMVSGVDEAKLATAASTVVAMARGLLAFDPVDSAGVEVGIVIVA